jgi:hypothetical protein
MAQTHALDFNGVDQTAETHKVQFDGRQETNGVYFLRMTAGKKVFTKKMVLLNSLAAGFRSAKPAS